jgi:transcriptional regulator with XRE-family HTH domain
MSMKASVERRQINGEWVKAVRKCLGLSQAALAERVGVSLPAVARWEIGAFRPSKLAGKALLDFADAHREELGALAKGESPVTGQGVRKPQRSLRSSHVKLSPGRKA